MGSNAPGGGRGHLSPKYEALRQAGRCMRVPRRRMHSASEVRGPSAGCLACCPTSRPSYEAARQAGRCEFATAVGVRSMRPLGRLVSLAPNLMLVSESEVRSTTPFGRLVETLGHRLCDVRSTRPFGRLVSAVRDHLADGQPALWSVRSTRPFGRLVGLGLPCGPHSVGALRVRSTRPFGRLVGQGPEHRQRDGDAVRSTRPFGRLVGSARPGGSRALRRVRSTRPFGRLVGGPYARLVFSKVCGARCEGSADQGPLYPRQPRLPRQNP